MTIKYMMNTTPNKTKPLNINAKSFKTKSATIDDLIKDIESGRTIRPGLLNANGSCDKDWLSQELVFLDIDDNTIADTINTCKLLDVEPLMLYKTFGYTEVKQKHRVVFKLAELISDVDSIKLLIKTLTVAFNADSRCTNLARLYYGTNYKCDVVNVNATIDITIVDKINTLLGRPAQTPHGFLKCDDKITTCSETNVEISIATRDKSEVTSCIKDPQSISLYINVDCGSFSQLRNTVYASYGNVSKAFKQHKLSDFLGIEGERCRCIFPDHEDHKESAAIYKTEAGYYYYKCFACDNKPMDLYDFIALEYGIEGSNDYKYYTCTNILIDMFNLKLDRGEWAKQKSRSLIANKIILNKKDYYLKNYKSAKELMKRDHLLRALMDEASICLELSPNKDKRGRLVFSVSLRRLGQMINKDFSSIGKWLKLLCYLGFVEKIDLKDIKGSRLYNSVTQNQKSNQKSLQLYSIPEWTDELFKSSDIKYELYKKNGGTIKGATARQFEALGSKKTVIQKNKETDEIRSIRSKLYAYVLSYDYCLVKDLKEFGKELGYSERLIASFITELSTDKNIKYFRYTTKEIKKMYGLEDTIHHSNSIFINK